MTIEITPGLIAMGVGWITSSLTAAWFLSRRSQQWDEVADVLIAVFGDRRTGKKGLMQMFDDLRDDLEEVKVRQRGALRGLRANFQSEQEVETAVRTALDASNKSGRILTPIHGPLAMSLLPKEEDEE